MKRYGIFVLVLLVLALAGYGERAVAQGDPAADLAAGIEQFDAGAYEPALNLFRSAVTGFRSQHDAAGEAQTLYYLGETHLAMGNYYDARNNYWLALPIYRDQLGDRRYEGLLLQQIGWTYHVSGDYGNSQSFYFQALNVRQTIGDQAGEADNLALLGRWYHDQELYTQALENYQQAQIIYRQLGNQEHASRLLVTMADIYLRTWQIDAAQDHYEQALYVAQALDDEAQQAYALRSLGILASLSGQYQTALTYFQQALDIYRQTGDQVGEGRTLAMIGNTYRELGYTSALETLREAISIQRVSGDEEGQAETLNYIGELLYEQRDYGQALNNFEQARDIALRIDSTRNEAMAYHGIARVYADSTLGAFSQALDNFGYAIGRFRDSLGDVAGSREVFISMGWAHFGEGEFDTAFTYFYQALNIAQGALGGLTDRRGEAIALTNLGDAHSRQSDYGQALRYYEQALPIFQEVQDDAGVGATLNAIGDLYRLQAQYVQALERYHQARLTYHDMGNVVYETAAFANIGQVYQAQGQYSLAMENYNQALNLLNAMEGPQASGSRRDEVLAAAYQSQGSLYLEVGLYDEAISSLQQALDMQNRANNDGAAGFTHSLIGEVYLAQGSYQRALNSFQETRLIGERLQDVRLQGLAFHGIARSYAADSRLATFRDALNNFDFALSRFRDVLNDPVNTRLVFTSLSQAYFNRGEVDQGFQNLFQALNVAQSALDQRGEAFALMNLADTHLNLSRFDNVAGYYEQAADLFGQLGDWYQQGKALNSLGQFHLRQARYVEALDYFQQALAAFEDADDLLWQGIVQINIGRNYQAQGQYADALYQYDLATVAIDADAAAQTLRPPTLAASSRGQIELGRGELFLTLDQDEAALSYLEPALEYFREAEDAAGEGRTCSAIGEVYLAQGNYRQAQNWFEQAVNLLEETGDVCGQAQVYAYLARMHRLDAEHTTFQEILDYHQRALGRYRDLCGDPVGTRETFTSLAWAYYERNSFEDAETYFFQALHEAQNALDAPGEAQTLTILAGVYSEQSDITQALRLYEDALEIYDELNDLAGQGETLEAVGDLHYFQGRYLRALEYYQQMRDVYSRAGDWAHEAAALDKIGLVYLAQGLYSQAADSFALARAAVDVADTSDTFAIVGNAQEVEEAFATLQTAVSGAIYRSQGRLNLALEQYDAAQENFEQALDLQRTLDSDLEYGRTLSHLGELYLALGEYLQAQDSFEQARNIANRAGDIRYQALAYYGLAQVYTQSDLATFSEAEQNYQLAIGRFRDTLGDPVGTRNVFTSWGWAYHHRGDFATAQDYFYQALHVAEDANDTLGISYAYMNLGAHYTGRLLYNDAIDFYEQALLNFGAEDTVGKGIALAAIGDLYRGQGRYDLALTRYQEMLAIFEATEDHVRQGLALSNIGLVYQGEGIYGQALNYQFQALARLQTAQGAASQQDVFAISNEGTVYRRLGTVQLEMAQYEAAAENLALALTRATAANDRLGIAETEHLLGNLLATQGQYEGQAGEDGALDYYDRALSTFQNFNDQAQQARLLLDMGEAYLTLGQENPGLWNVYGARAETNYQQALGIAREIDNPLLQAIALNNLGRIQLRKGQEDLARDYHLTALQNVRDLNSSPQEAMVLIDLGLFYEELGDTAQAIAYYQEAIPIVEDIHASIRLQGEQISFSARNIVPYHRLVSLYAASDQPEAAFTIAERGRARTFLFQLSSERVQLGDALSRSTTLLEEWYQQDAELRALRSRRVGLRNQITQGETGLDDELEAVEELIMAANVALTQLEEELARLDPGLAQLLRVQVPTLSEIQGTLPEDATMLAYYIIPPHTIFSDRAGRAYVFVVTRGDLAMVPLPGTGSPVGIYQELANAVTAMQINPNNLDTLQLLYRLLVEPVANRLDTGELIIVSHDMLNFVPFASLVSDPETFLGERFTISYSPSATVHTYQVQHASASPAAPGQGTALVIGVNNPGGRTLISLQNAEMEARRVAEILNVEAITGDAVTEQMVMDAIEDVDVVHIAAHGDFGVDSPLDSFLALSAPLLLETDVSPDNDSRLTVREVYALRLRQSPLVVLSACETAAGEISQGDEVQGLARAFLLSGARSVIASLWSVDDAATVELMVHFYQLRTQEGMTDAQALAAAQAYLRDTFPEWDLPYYWAPFILVGQPNEPGG